MVLNKQIACSPAVVTHLGVIEFPADFPLGGGNKSTVATWNDGAIELCFNRWGPGMSWVRVKPDDLSIIETKHIQVDEDGIDIHFMFSRSEGRYVAIHDENKYFDVRHRHYPRRAGDDLTMKSIRKGMSGTVRAALKRGDDLWVLIEGVRSFNSREANFVGCEIYETAGMTRRAFHKAIGRSFLWKVGPGDMAHQSEVLMTWAGSVYSFQTEDDGMTWFPVRLTPLQNTVDVLRAGDEISMGIPHFAVLCPHSSRALVATTRYDVEAWRWAADEIRLFDFEKMEFLLPRVPLCHRRAGDYKFERMIQGIIAIPQGFVTPNEFGLRIFDRDLCDAAVVPYAYYGKEAPPLNGGSVTTLSHPDGGTLLFVTKAGGREPHSRYPYEVFWLR